MKLRFILWIFDALDETSYSHNEYKQNNVYSHVNSSNEYKQNVHLHINSTNEYKHNIYLHLNLVPTIRILFRHLTKQNPSILHATVLPENQNHDVKSNHIFLWHFIEHLLCTPQISNFWVDPSLSSFLNKYNSIRRK